MENIKVYIITEGSSSIGFGHITRMLSIYQAFEEKGIKPKFIINGDDTILDLIKDTEYEIYNWLENKDKLLSEIKNTDIAIIDSYLANKELYERISKVVKVPVYYDDNNRINYPCGVVVNGNIYAKELDYPKKDCIKYLLGLEYLPLRKEFWEVPEKKIKDKVESIMITFGGDDLRNLTPKVLNFLTKNYPNLNKYVVIGKGFKNIQEIENVADGKTNLIFNADAKKMKEIMLKSDIAISAGGQTLYELIRVGVPTISIIVVDNQINNVRKLEKIGSIENAGLWNEKNLFNKLRDYIEKLIHNVDARKKLVEVGKRYIDGRGVFRLVRVLLHKNIVDNLNIRNVKDSDIWEIYKISNEPYVRKNSLCTRPITKEEHINWFKAVNKKYFWVAEYKEKIIGQIRISFTDEKYFINVSIHKHFRGVGVGKKLLEYALDKFWEDNETKEIFAIIRKDNKSSLFLFKEFGFKYIGDYNNNFYILKKRRHK